MTTATTQTAAGAPVRSEALFGQIADEVFAAIRDAKPFKWTTWDSWAGRPVFNERETKRDAVIEVLKRHWPNASADGERSDTVRREVGKGTL
jgi:hypothetical protein